MGREATGAVRIGDARGKAKVLLETDELLFRGEVKGRVPFRALTAIEPGPDGLRLVWPDGEALVGLAGTEAGRWAERISNPPSLLDKLGVQDGTRVAVLDPDNVVLGDEGFAAELAGRAVDVEAADLARLPALVEWIHPAGALWAVWVKGRKELNENHVREAALDAGLVDVKVARFSATRSALKLVVPKAKRGAR